MIKVARPGVKSNASTKFIENTAKFPAEEGLCAKS
jgi:hypothetical protein